MDQQNEKHLQALVDVTVSELNERDEWLMMNMATATPDQLERFNREYLATLDRINARIEQVTN